MTTTCYHGRRLGPDGDTSAAVEVIAHDAPAGLRVPLVHFVKHSPAGFSWGYGGSGPADLARSILIDALGAAALCSGCDGRGRVVWLGPDEDSDPLPYDPDLHGGADPDMVSSCYCDGGIRSLPYQGFKFDVVAGWGDRWTITRAEVLRWVVGHYGEIPAWLSAVIPVRDLVLPA